MEIKLRDIAHVQRLLMEIFEYQDDDYGRDGRVVANKERGIEHTLSKITKDRKKQREIENTIYDGMWDENPTYKPICDRLRAKGYKIIKEVKTC